MVKFIDDTTIIEDESAPVHEANDLVFEATKTREATDLRKQ